MGRFLSGFTTRTLYAFLISLVRVACPYHFLILDFVMQTLLRYILGQDGVLGTTCKATEDEEGMLHARETWELYFM
jgi:hypothetical protein